MRSAFSGRQNANTSFTTDLLKVYSIVEKIPTNHKRSFRILDNSIRFYTILDKNARKSISILKKMLQDLRKKIRKH